ncbi:MAG: hypothetical protein GY922_12050 [Proteobacteria bacterium]|nr:hypothetical protein [Pseudomonadota bacterium]
MLTLNAAFTEEFAKAEVEAVLLVQIYTGTTDPSPYVFCTGSKGMVLSGIYNPFTGGTSGARDVYPLVVACTPVSIDMDPYERTVVKNSVTVTLADHPHIRSLVKNTVITGQAVTIKLGTLDISNELHWAPVFTGVAESFSYREGGLDIECRDFWRWRGAALTHSWINKHPLEVIKYLLEIQGVPSANIDADMFDPDHADYASTIGHYVTTHSGTIINTPALDLGHRSRSRSTQVDLSKGLITEQFEPLIQSIVKLMVGCLYFDEAGDVRFVAFNAARAVSVDWVSDDIRDFIQTDGITVNEIVLELHGERAGGGIPVDGLVTIKDATSQTAHAYPGESVGVFRRSEMFPHVTFHGEALSISSTGALSPLLVLNAYGLSGTRIPDGAYSNPWDSMQGAGAGLTADKPLHLLVGDEVMKCVSMDLVEDFVVSAAHYTHTGGWGTGTAITLVDKPGRAEFTITSGNRGQLGTTAATHEDAWTSHGDASEPPVKVFDITMHADYALTQLQRFSNGCPFVELTTNLSQWAVQVGDLVTVTHDNFLAFGFDGIDDDYTWEVVGKELTLSDSDASIKFALAYATKASPPTINATYVWPQQGVRGLIDLIDGLQFAGEDEVGVSRHTVAGLGVSSSGLDVTVQKGILGSPGKATPIATQRAFTVGASKDHYVSADARTGNIEIDTVTTGAAQPGLGRFSVPLAKVRAGGSSCTITDLRTFGAVRPRNLSTKDFEAGGNLCPNPDFEAWSRGPGFPPDGWEMVTGTWGTDAIRGEDDPSSGLYGIKIPNASKSLASKKFRVEADRVYQVGATVFGSASALEIFVGVRWYSGTGTLLSTTYAINQSSLHTALTRRDLPLVAPSTASYASVILLNGAQAGFGLYDAVRFVRAQPSFFVTNTTQTLGKSTDTLIDFDVEAHDTGGFFNTTLGQNKFVAPFDGIYEFKAQVLGSNLTNNHADSYLWLSKNSSEILRGSKSYTGTSSEYDYHIDSGPVKLEKDDIIQIIYNSAHTSNSVLTGSTTQNFFSGVQIQ